MYTCKNAITTKHKDVRIQQGKRGKEVERSKGKKVQRYKCKHVKR